MEEYGQEEENEVFPTRIQRRREIKEEIKKQKAAHENRRGIFRDNNELFDLCYHNGISEAQYLKGEPRISALEMCHYNLPTITGLHYFPNLTVLCIVAQDIKTISGLDACPLLECLWICETLLTEISGLEKMGNLTQLYLYSNRIKRIGGMESLGRLETLSLADNDIRVLENLESFTSLKTLLLGNNKIKLIGNSLNSCNSLQELNISGNQISSFREILHLSRLKSLQHLCLSDPNYSDNPICALCNYQTYIVHHLPNLITFDTLEVTGESRTAISATIIKKRMYYNMRIITIRRNCDFLKHSLASSCASKMVGDAGEGDKMGAILKKIQMHIDVISLRKVTNGLIDPELEKMKRLKGVVQEKRDFICAFKGKVTSQLQVISSQIETQCNEAIRSLLLELETGGNARFEDEQKNSQWIGHCEKQIKKFIKRAASKESPKTIQIHRISRMHNRGSKLKFEERVEKLGPSDKAGYLCFTPNKENNDVFEIAECGFDDSRIIMTNYFDCREEIVPSDNYLRKVIIVRTNQMQTQEVSEDLSFDAFASLGSASFPAADGISQRVILHNDVSNSAPADLPRRYLVYNRECIMPEYLVEYSLDSDFAPSTNQIQRLILDIAFSNRISHANMPMVIQELSSKIKNPELPDELASCTLENLYLTYPELKLYYENLKGPATEYKKYLLNGTTNNEYVNLSGFQSIQADFFAMRSFLKTIVINHADLTSFPEMKQCPLLEVLDLSFNRIPEVPVLNDTYPLLRKLLISSNQVHQLISLLNISKSSNLQEIDLSLNPVCEIRDFSFFLARKIPTLIRLNEQDVKEKHDSLYLDYEWDSFLLSRSSDQVESFRPMSIRTSSGSESSALEQKYYRTIITSSVANSLSIDAITTLELDSCQLLNLSRLPESMANLRWASFRNNYISDVSKLSNYLSLEELSLERNQIENIDSLSQLSLLKKLDVSRNLISSVDNCEFQSIMFLALEKNKIKSLRSFSKMTTLFELYVGDNVVSHLFTTFPLKELPRLIILDLTGNPVCKLQNFRLFTVFHLNRLKILNGSGVTLKDQTQAKDIYMGKLTIELLGEKIGHFNFKNITELDLRNCKIKEIDCLSGSDFRSLRKLNFDNNLLVNIDCFASLSGLQHLSVNNNKLERLLSYDGSLNDFKPLKSFLPNLEELFMGYNNISRISDLGLHRLYQLKILYLQGNRIMKVDGLEQMTNLIELVLDKNQIKAIDNLSFISLINLKELHIKENRLKSLANFDCMPNLQILYLTGNRIHEMSEIEKMKLPSILEISLANNAVCRKQLYRIGLVIRFPHLIGIDGKEVTNEERQRAHTFYLEQCLIREDPVSKIVNSVSGQNVMGQSYSSKNSVKIASVVLDGLEMRLSSSNNVFGGGFR